MALPLSINRPEPCHDARQLTLGYSPCPNDTYIFYALVHGKVPVPGITFRERLEDVETLNQLALDGTLDITKISYHALGHLRERYALLRSGGALGRGCGPLIVARPGTRIENVRSGTVAIPGRLTTAWLLLRLYRSGADERRGHDLRPHHAGRGGRYGDRRSDHP